MRFVTEAGRLRGVLRQTMLAELGRRENSAEHSWHLALMAIALAEHAPAGTDISRVIAMVLLHDLVEIDAGDLFAYADPALQRQQEATERASADRIFAILPADQAIVLRALWDEFNDRASADAKFARALDRLQPMLENVAAGGGTWSQHSIAADQVLAKVELIEDGSAALGELARDLVADAVAAGILAPARSVPPGRDDPPEHPASPRRDNPSSAREEDQLDGRDETDQDDDDPQHAGGKAAAELGPDQAADRGPGRDQADG
jgi:putative hydrolase of HD superfamily